MDGESVYSIARCFGLCVRFCPMLSETPEHFTGSCYWKSLLIEIWSNTALLSHLRPYDILKLSIVYICDIPVEENKRGGWWTSKE